MNRDIAYCESLRYKLWLWHLLPIEVKWRVAKYDGGRDKISLRRLARLVAIYVQIPQFKKETSWQPQ